MSRFIVSNAPEDMPSVLALFPLSGALLLPRGQLPLNVFEPRYLAMIDDALRSHRTIGMIQPDGDTAGATALFASPSSRSRGMAATSSPSPGSPGSPCWRRSRP